jgi:hypothetical protein
MFVTSQGHAYPRFQRVLASGNATLAWATAAECSRLELHDALALCLLVVDDVKRYTRAAARWHARYVAEVRGVTLAESQLVAAALAAIPGGAASTAAVEALAHLAEQRGLTRVAQALDAHAPNPLFPNSRQPNSHG